MIPDAISSEQLNKFRKLGKSWLSNAENSLEDAQEEFERRHYSESVLASIQCIELSMKSIYLFYGFEPPKIHKVELEIENRKENKQKLNPFKIAIEQLETILEREKFPPHITPQSIIKCFLNFKFWGEFYTLAKYGSLRFGMGPEKLFGRQEAELALCHAEECRLLAYYIKDYLKLY